MPGARLVRQPRRLLVDEKRHELTSARRSLCSSAASCRTIATPRSRSRPVGPIRWLLVERIGRDASVTGVGVIPQCAVAGAGKRDRGRQAGTSIASATPSCLLGARSAGLSHKRIDNRTPLSSLSAFTARPTALHKPNLERTLVSTEGVLEDRLTMAALRVRSVCFTPGRSKPHERPWLAYSRRGTSRESKRPSGHR